MKIKTCIQLLFLVCLHPSMVSYASVDSGACGLVNPEVTEQFSGDTVSIRAMSSCHLENGELVGYGFNYNPSDGLVEDVVNVRGGDFDYGLNRNIDFTEYYQILRLEKGREFLQDYFETDDEILFIYSDSYYLYSSSLDKKSGAIFNQYKVATNEFISINQANFKLFHMAEKVYLLIPRRVGKNPGCNVKVMSVSKDAQSYEMQLGMLPNCSSDFQLSVSKSRLLIMGQTCLVERGCNDGLWSVLYDFERGSFNEIARRSVNLDALLAKPLKGSDRSQ